ncbi:hypothetical protein LguiA_006679 [Lonicera macranthoides]
MPIYSSSSLPLVLDSYSNTTSDYKFCGDNITAQDSYTFLVNWLERFPEYKTQDFYITGESCAGHYVPQLAQTIVHNNKNTNKTIGNAHVDDETTFTGAVDFMWSHALMSDEVYQGIELNCNFSSYSLSDLRIQYLNKVDAGNLYLYNVYAPLCGSSSESNPAALHANMTSLPYPWEAKAKVENSTSGCTTLIIYLQQKIEEWQSRVTALEALQSRVTQNIEPDIISTTVNLPQPGVLSIDEDFLGYLCSGGLRLLTSTKKAAPDILPTTVNLSEHGALPAYPNMSDYQAALEGFSGRSSQVGSVAEVV